MFKLTQGSSAVSQIMTQKLGALPHLSPLLSSPNQDLRKTAISLLSNMSRSASSSVQNTMGLSILLFLKAHVNSNTVLHEFFHVFFMFVSLPPLPAKQVLPELIGLLSTSPKELGIKDEAISTACSTAQTLMVANPEASKKLINNELVSSLADLTENG